MSLVSQIVSFATRVATEFNSLRSEVATVADATLPTGGGTGQILAKVDGVDFNTEWIDNFAPNVELYAKNETGETLYKGQAVYIVGADNSASFPRLALADADSEATSSKTIGVLKQDLLTGAFGYVITEGLLEGIDTSAATSGSSIWLSGTPGGFVFGAPPAKPAHGVYLGVVIRANANNGKIYVKVQNGLETSELHDWSAVAPSNGQVPVWNSSTGLYTPGSVAAAAIVSETPPVGSSSGASWYKSSTGQSYTNFDGYWVEDASVGASGPQGVQGPSGVVAATAPLTYSSSTNTVAIQNNPQFTGRIRAKGISGDASGVLELQSLDSGINYIYKENAGGTVFSNATSTTLRVNADGSVQQLLQPTFTARSDQATTQGNDIVWNTVDYQVGSSYNASNGRFTAPTTGYYYFHAHGLWGNGDSGDRRIGLYKNGGGFPGMRFITYKVANNWHTWFVDGVVYMAAGDYATIRVEQSGQGLHTDNNYNQFSGRLLG